MKTSLSCILMITLYLQLPCYAGQWINPKDVIGDPMIARLQGGRAELNGLEKSEIEKYGFTGLEIITYLDGNLWPGKDNDAFYRLVHVTAGGNITVSLWIRRDKHYFKDNRAIVTHDGIKPGEIKEKERHYHITPPDIAEAQDVIEHFMTSEKFQINQREWVWLKKTRKISPYESNVKEDNYAGTELTYDEFRRWRRPWEEDHRILGEDRIDGYDCFVVESKNHNPKYYLSKRLSWVEKNNFIDLHEEQFGRDGRLLKVFDKKWEQVKPWNYWVRKELNVINLKSRDRTLLQTAGWIFDQGLEDSFFYVGNLNRRHIWRDIKDPFPSVKKVSDLPPPPQVQSGFWQEIGVKPELAK
ncbi:MAG: outer membrane lipoprotein-sorting protein [Candidatus Binatia bacterium]